MCALRCSHVLIIGNFEPDHDEFCGKVLCMLAGRSGKHWCTASTVCACSMFTNGCPFDVLQVGKTGFSFVTTSSTACEDDALPAQVRERAFAVVRSNVTA